MICTYCRKFIGERFYTQSNINPKGWYCSINCLTQQLNKEQQMIHKFKVGDRVKYNLDKISSKNWDGTGTVVNADDNSSNTAVEFDEGTGAANNWSQKHWCNPEQLELLPMQDKALIKPEDYHTLKKDDEVEITIKGKLNYDQKQNPNLIAITADRCNSINHLNNIKEVHKLTPKATKLEVGEIICSTINPNNNYKVVAVAQNGFVTKSNEQIHLIARNNEFPNHYKTWAYRASGIPIDWDATFS